MKLPSDGLVRRLTKVAPYHSGARRDPSVHHVRSDCLEGQKIRSSNLLSGTGKLPLCDTCRALDDVVDLTEQSERV